MPIKNPKVALIGLMGSGKTTLAATCAKTLGWKHWDLDDYIQLKEKKTVTEIFTQKGEDYFRQCETSALSYLLQEPAPWIIATGGGTPCFSNNLMLLQRHTFLVYLQANSSLLYQRLINNRAARPLIATLSDQQLLARLDNLLACRLPYYQKADLQLHADQPLDQLVKQLINYIIQI